MTPVLAMSGTGPSRKPAMRSPSGVESTVVRGRRMISGGRAGTPSAAMMITHEGSGRRLVDPPGTILYVRNYRLKDGQAAFVYLEFRNKRRRDLKSVARHLGRGAMKRLRRGRARDRMCAGTACRHIEIATPRKCV
jgi:hypothetical protein